MQKRGFFFTIDVLIAMIVIVVGFLLIWSSMASKTHVVQPYFLAQDIIDFVSTTRIIDITSTEYITELINDGNITDIALTVAEQMALFFHQNVSDPLIRDNTLVLANFTRAVLSNSTPMQYSFEFRIYNEVFNRSLYLQQNPMNRGPVDSESLVSSKTIVSVPYKDPDDGLIAISDPYVIEVRVWQ